MRETRHAVHERGARASRRSWRSRLLLWVAAGLTSGLAAACSGGGGGGDGTAPPAGVQGDWDVDRWDQFDWN